VPAARCSLEAAAVPLSAVGFARPALQR